MEMSKWLEDYEYSLRDLTEKEVMAFRQVTNEEGLRITLLGDEMRFHKKNNTDIWKQAQKLME